jgi:hypothetical protein
MPDGLLYVSDIFTLQPRIGDRSIDLKTAALGQEPRFRYRIRGKPIWAFSGQVGYWGAEIF